MALHMGIAIVVLEYLKVILNWPVTGAAVFIFFLFRHRSTIDKILQSLKKAGPIEFQGGKTENTEALPVGSAVAQPNYEFLYLSQAGLANTTKNELFKLATLGSKTLEQFKDGIVLPEATPDKTLEREAIFTTLLRFKLIEMQNSSLQATTKGKELLRFIGYSVPD